MIYKRNCNNCGKYYEGWGVKYCSKKCNCQIVSPFKKGHKPSLGTKIKQSEILKEKFRKGELKIHSWNKGHITKPEESKGYLVKQCKNCGIEFSVLWKKNQIFCGNNCANSMENNSSWMGGISFEPYGLEFNNGLKEQIRTRDNYTCQECNYTQEQLKRKLTIHHIDYNKKNNHPNNLISLCLSCHAQTNFNRNKWIEYYQKKVIPIAN